MITGPDSITRDLVALALDAAAMRHEVIANNLANIHSENYATQRVNFEEQLSALRKTVREGVTPARAALDAVRPFVETDAVTGYADTGVMIDREMLKLAQNTVHYQALLKALAKRGAIMSLAVNEGRK